MGKSGNELVLENYGTMACKGIVHKNNNTRLILQTNTTMATTTITTTRLTTPPAYLNLTFNWTFLYCRKWRMWPKSKLSSMTPILIHCAPPLRTPPPPSPGQGWQHYLVDITDHHGGEEDLGEWDGHCVHRRHHRGVHEVDGVAVQVDHDGDDDDGAS